MRWALMLWLVGAGTGLSYSVITERKRQLNFLKAMEYGIKQAAYYICTWHMPVEEVLKQLQREGGMLSAFYASAEQALLHKNAQSFGSIWQQESIAFFKEEKLPEDIKALWQNLFYHMPMETEGIQKRLLLQEEELCKAHKRLEEKYKGEQRLVVTMGFFAGAFLCLILW